MNETEKLLRKISKRDRDELLSLIDALSIEHERKRLRPIKLQGSNLYRIRRGNFRIIFHVENGIAIIDAVRFRNEKTYRL